MKPFCIVAIGAILGIVTGLYLKGMALLLFVAMIILIIILVIKHKLTKNIIVVCMCFISFFIYVNILETKYEKIYNEYNNVGITVQGIIVSNGNEKKYKTTYEIRVLCIYNHNNMQLHKGNFNVLCDIKGTKDEIALKYGDEVIFETIFEAPEKTRNEGGFDYSKYLKTKKIAGKVSSKKENITIIQRNKICLFTRLVNELKLLLVNKIYQFLPKNEAGLCAALILGDKNGISTDVEENFRKASLSHMLAISGAHISYICLGMSAALDFFKIHKKWAKIFTCLLLLFFMFLAGGSPSIVRACIMVIFKLIAKILFLKPNTYNNLGISAFIIFTYNPYAILDLGLQLSFMGTIGIVTFVDLLYEIRLKKKGITINKYKKENNQKSQEKKYNKYFYKFLIYVEQTIIMSIAANILIIPITLYNFSTIYLMFLISNLLATPIMGACLILGMIFLLCIVIKPFAYVISLLLTPLLKIFIFIANFSSKIPFAKFLCPRPKIWQIVIYYLIILIYFFRSKIEIIYPNIVKVYKKIIILLIIIILLPYVFQIIPKNKLEINFIDVGQGDCMLIMTPLNKRILVDGGGSEFGSFDVGKQTLLPYLLNKSILSIDYMLFTHFDADHCQGLLTVLENITVKNIIVGEQGKQSENFNIFLNLVSKKM